MYASLSVSVCLRALFCFCVLCSKEFAPLCFSMLMHSAKNLCICMCGCICVSLLLCQPFSLYVCHSSYLSASSCLCLSLYVSRLLHVYAYILLFVYQFVCLHRNTRYKPVWYNTIRMVWNVTQYNAVGLLLLQPKMPSIISQAMVTQAERHIRLRRQSLFFNNESLHLAKRTLNPLTTKLASSQLHSLQVS